MEPRHLSPHVARLVASARAMEAAIKSEDPDLIAEAHAAVGRVRERIGPAVALMQRHAAHLAKPKAVA